MTEGTDPRRVNASPEKRFFIQMLVKDIELIPAVLDLVDNSVDGARALRTDSRLDDLWVKLDVRSEAFVISDNCGGIDLDVARNYAFRFGRPRDFPGIPGSVGQFGVGMKRALFKIGTAFTVISKAQRGSFKLEVDVEEWAAQSGPDWSFRLAELDAAYEATADTNSVGTYIKVAPLHFSVAEDFSLSSVVGALRDQLRLRHQDALDRGLVIILNDEPLRSFVPTLQVGNGIQPIRTSFTLSEEDGTVYVELFAGIVPPERETGDAEDDDAERFRTDGEAGWYVFCNQRLLLAGDRTSLTGWGSNAPAYHPQYRRFRGYVYLESTQPELLPWNTTKTSVDQDSRVWRRTAAQMRIALVEVCGLLNRLKDERQNAEDDSQRPISRALANATAVPLKSVPASPQVRFPVPSRPPVARADIRKIQYSVERARFNAVSEVLGTTSVSEVGRGTFDYFYQYQVDEDD